MTESANPQDSNSNESPNENQEAEPKLEAEPADASSGAVPNGTVPNEPVPDSKELATLNSELADLKSQIVSTQDKYLRSLADFENFKRRSIKERADLLKYQGEPLILDLIKVVDDLDLAIQYKDSDANKFREGVELIYKSLCDVLNKWDIRSESAMGKEFDPIKHAAISKVPAQDTTPGTVVSELKKVFFYKDKLIRVGEVVVAVEQSS